MTLLHSATIRSYWVSVFCASDGLVGAFRAFGKGDLKTVTLIAITDVTTAVDKKYDNYYFLDSEVPVKH